jgi:hypothetical protein
MLTEISLTEKDKYCSAFSYAEYQPKKKNDRSVKTTGTPWGWEPARGGG